MVDNVDIYPYSRDYEAGKKEILKKTKSGYSFKITKPFAWDRLFICFLGFFLGRAILLGELMPFGPAFSAASLAVLPGCGAGAVLGVLAGILSVVRGSELACQAAVIMAVAVLMAIIPGGKKGHRLLIPGLVTAAVIITKTSYLAFSNPVPYNYVSTLFEAVFAGFLTFVFISALPMLVQLKKYGKLSLENVFYLIILFAGFIAGTGELSYWQLSLKGLLSRIAILSAAAIGGAGMGAAAGAVVGVIPGIAFAAVPAMVGAYSFAGLLAGLCRGFKKIGVAVGFILGNIILCVYMSNYQNMAGVLAESGLAVLFFFLIPQRFMNLLQSSMVGAGEVKKENVASPTDNHFKKILASRVEGMAGVFLELSKSFEQVSSTVMPEQEQGGLQKLLEQIGAKVCGECPLYRTCWEREFYRTYQLLLDLLAELETGSNISVDALPEYLRSRCTRTKEMIITVSCYYELYRFKKLWSGKVCKSRNIISDQLKSIYSIMDRLSQELQLSAEFAGQNDADLLQSLNQRGFEILDLYTEGHTGGHLEIGLTMSSCQGQMDCRYKVAPAVSDLLGQPYSVIGTDCSLKNGEEKCSFRLFPTLTYRLEVGVARAAKVGNVVSGDSYSVVYLNRGKVALVLSDGMGSGEEAAKESSTTITLLEKLLQSGLERELAIKMVNSMMLLRSPEDSFATIDLVIVDLCSGNSEFIKIGAPASFLLRGQRAAKINSGSLPAGIIDDIEITTISKCLTAGDTLVMVTDGITDSYRGAGEKEDWLVRVLQDVNHLSPQELAELIMKLSQTGSGGQDQLQDDMTVLVARVERENI